MAIHCYGLPTLELALNQNSMGFQIKGIFWGSLQKGLQSVVKYIYIYIYRCGLPVYGNYPTVLCCLEQSITLVLICSLFAVCLAHLFAPCLSCRSPVVVLNAVDKPTIELLLQTSLLRRCHELSTSLHLKRPKRQRHTVNTKYSWTILFKLPSNSQARFPTT